MYLILLEETMSECQINGDSFSLSLSFLLFLHSNGYLWYSGNALLYCQSEAVQIYATIM